ncbi:MAG: hypothetical protein R2809_04745 [Flavobacteriales bacterium]
MRYLAIIMLVALPSLLRAQNDEPVGSAEYFYVNTSDTTVHIYCTLLPQLGNKIVEVDVLPGETKSIFQDGIIGVNPSPADTFKSIKITLSSNREILIEKEAINNSWKAETPDRKDGESYYHTNYYLSLE